MFHVQQAFFVSYNYIVQKKQLNKITGNLGESIATKFLINKGFRIAERNFYRSVGEIDIVAHETSTVEDLLVSRETSPRIHFIEVKTVSYETKELLNWAVTHETYRPEELVHQKKLEKIQKAAEVWMLENKWSGEVAIDVVAVRIVPREKYARVRYIPDVIVG